MHTRLYVCVSQCAMQLVIAQEFDLRQPPFFLFVVVVVLVGRIGSLELLFFIIVLSNMT